MKYSSDNRQLSGMGRGFTLIELLVVLVILALVMGIAAPVVQRADERSRLDMATAQIYEGLRRARSSAVVGGAQVVVDVRKMVNDGAIEIEAVMQDAPAARLTFYPDGSATSSRIILKMAGQRRNLSIDWLTGQAALVE